MIALCVLVTAVAGGIYYYATDPLWTSGSQIPLGDLVSVRETHESPPLSGIELHRLSRQREVAAELARRYVGTALTGSSESDLRVLQEILDRGVLRPDQTFELQCLGVALGDVLAAQLDLHWVAYEDDLGRSRALRLGDTDVVLFPITMISKRVEAGIEVSVQGLYETAQSTVRKTRPRV